MASASQFGLLELFNKDEEETEDMVGTSDRATLPIDR